MPIRATMSAYCSPARERRTKNLAHWTTYKRGRRSAQVGIVWDLVWEMFRADNYEDSVNFLFRIIWIVVSNFVLFMITSTIVFTFKVISVIRSFQPSLIR